MKKILCSIIVASVGITACSSDSNSGVGAQSAAGAAYKTASNSLSSLSGLSPAPVTSMVLLNPRATGLGTHWNNTTLGFQDERQDPGVAVSLKDFMGIQFSPNASRPDGSGINVFSRMKNSGAIMCLFANAISAPTSASLVATGSATITFNSTVQAYMISDCGFEAADVAGLPSSVSLTFTAPNSTAIFDVKIVVDLGGEIETMYAKWGSSDGVIAFASAEDNDNGRTRTVVIYNANTGILRGEYLSKTKIDGYGMTIHRLWKDNNSGHARVLTVFNQNYSDATSDTSPSNSLIYIVDGNTSSTYTNTSLGISFSGYGAGNGTYEACVAKSTGTVADATVVSNEFTCTNTGGTIGKATSGNSVAPISDFNTLSITASPNWSTMTNAPRNEWTDADDIFTGIPM